MARSSTLPGALALEGVFLVLFCSAAVHARMMSADVQARSSAYNSSQFTDHMSYVMVHNLTDFVPGFSLSLFKPLGVLSHTATTTTATTTTTTTPKPPTTQRPHKPHKPHTTQRPHKPEAAMMTTPRPLPPPPPPPPPPPHTTTFAPHRTPSTSHPDNSSIRPADSPIGYEVECGVRNTPSLVDEANRIVGGVTALPGEFPWQVSLQLVRSWSAKHICGGAVLSAHWVVSAGHCVDGLEPEQLSVVAGDHDLFKIEGNEQRRKVVRIVGRGYNKETFANDISLLQLSRPLTLRPESVAPICIPHPTKKYRKGEATVTGWGRLSETGALPHTLQQVSLPLIPWSRCKSKYHDAGYGSFLHTCQICSGREQGGLDSCQGDSGGPLACPHKDGRYYLCGVVSWGVGCARARYPGVYTEVSCYTRWIHRILYNEGHVLDPSR